MHIYVCLYNSYLHMYINTHIYMKKTILKIPQSEYRQRVPKRILGKLAQAFWCIIMVPTNS